ncbi:hypothetical protein ADUPG1_001124, partial [Aduncisulcus paluster]
PSKESCPYLDVLLYGSLKKKGIHKSALLDTGAFLSVISAKLFHELSLRGNLEVFPCDMELIMGDGRVIEALGKTTLSFDVPRWDSKGVLTFSESLIVIPMADNAPVDLIIGYQTILDKDLFSTSKSRFHLVRR